MKVEKIKKKFEPVVITLESEEEFDFMKSALRMAYCAGFNEKSSEVFCKKLLEELENAK